MPACMHAWSLLNLHRLGTSHQNHHYKVEQTENLKFLLEYLAQFAEKLPSDTESEDPNNAWKISANHELDVNTITSVGYFINLE